MIETAAEILDLPEQTAGPYPQTDWTIAMSVDVDADANRIFHALTVPEYIEAWMRIPDDDPDSRLVASQLDNGYCLRHFSGGRAAITITSCYLFCHRRKMRFSWQKTAGLVHADSIVDLRLRGNFGSSILELKHLRLVSPDEFAWHCKLWQNSLEKLAFLLRAA